MEELDRLRQAASQCRDCALWRNATQTVFGDGGGEARVMLVCEQPGDKDDLTGKPFTGPAGELLQGALQAAEVIAAELYFTYAVKHFKWEPKGLRDGHYRVSKKPTLAEIRACHQWLQGEIQILRPRVIVCLGATAASALLGTSFKLTATRGSFVPCAYAPFVFATFHPSAILRMPGKERRVAAFTDLVTDLRLIHQALA
jgi:uracil-DNA glycosylase family protein